MTGPTPADRSRIRPVTPVPFPERERALAPLPVALTSFVGREQEVAALVAVLGRPEQRLVTLTGPGGVGKTRLALRVAHEAGGAFPDGVWFVALAPVRDPALVAAAIAQALGIREAPGGPIADGVREFLRGRRALLLLDNVEHLLDAGPLVADLLVACPGLTVLATSRAVLRVSGEHRVDVAPLEVPDPDRLPPAARLAEIPAVRLFVERARASRADFALAPDTAGAVAAICAQLDGLPLAIELAAARVRHLPPPVLLDRLRRALPLLTGGGRDLPARHQTMRAALAWSYDLLAPDEQTLFRRLAVFVGGFTLEAAEAVVSTGDASDGVLLDRLASLIDQSLVLPLDVAGEPRFGMLETVREFGLERLADSGEEAGARGAHADYCLSFAERTQPELYGPQSHALLAALEREHGNFRAALAWFAQTGNGEALLRLTAALGYFWEMNGHWTEGSVWLERALAADPLPGRARVQALVNLGIIATYRDDPRREAALGEALALARQLRAPDWVATIH